MVRGGGLRNPPPFSVLSFIDLLPMSFINRILLLLLLIVNDRVYEKNNLVLLVAWGVIGDMG